jgi:hypothetical protein
VRVKVELLKPYRVLSICFPKLNSREMTMSDDKLRLLEERLTRLEAALVQRPPATGGFMQPGTIADPAPYPGGGGGWVFHPRPSPVVDPAPFPWGGLFSSLAHTSG